MITEFDEFAIHQTTNPIAHPGPSDRNFYDRHWFNGSDESGAFTFEVGFGLYPNRLVQDGHWSVVVDGVQHTFHGSRRAPLERSDSSVGPLRIEPVRPLRTVRVVLEKNDSGLECDLTFRAVTCPSEEPKNRLADGTRLLMESSRFTQFGRWEGSFCVGGVRTEVQADTTFATRDRSWGIRPVGEPEAGAPGQLSTPGVYWTWSPVQFDDVCTQYGTFQDPKGRPTQLSASIAPKYADVAAIPSGVDPGHREMAEMHHEIRWVSGTRRPASAALHLVSREGQKYDIELEPMTRFHLHAIGYQHPEWGHGWWKDELATGYESWRLDDLDPLDHKHIHLHSICRARMSGPDREREGYGVLETLVFGPHEPSGFASILDGAP